MVRFHAHTRPRMASQLKRRANMKITKLLTLGAMLGTCTFAAAQEKPERPKRDLPPQLLKKFDKDGDGKLSDEERTAMRTEMEAKRAEDMKKFDTDGDGKLSPDERKAMREAMQLKYKALIEKYDANKDGKLDPEERKAAADAGEELPMGPGPGERPEGKGPREGKKGGTDGAPPAPPAE